MLRGRYKGEVQLEVERWAHLAAWLEVQEMCTIAWYASIEQQRGIIEGAGGDWAVRRMVVQDVGSPSRLAA